MDKEQVYLQPAFLLHQRSYQNTSAIIDVFTRDFGRFSLVAKGVKRKKSPLKSVLQSFQPLVLSWVRRSELGVLTAAELQKPLIRLDHETLYSGLYLNELISRVLPPFDTVPELFLSYNEAIFALHGNLSPAVVLRVFERALLKSLGYEIQLRYEADSDKTIEANKYYCYQPEQGFREIATDENNALYFKGEHLIAFADNQFDKAETRQTAHRLTHMSLSRLLGDKPLESRKLYKAFKAINP
ncbi:MAG TPA: DNA repair protein RecO [Gammaproteobacteria bacterium]|nr:DNA repair protein RecO [Gammaproteobacteria bacterium]